MLRRRAPRACITCHNRKVRCDVSRKGTPCSNCSRAAVVCSVDDRGKERPMQHPGRTNLPQANVYTFKIGERSGCNRNGDKVVSPQTTAGGQASLACSFDNATPVECCDDGEIADTSPRDQSELPSYIAPLPAGLDHDIRQLLLSRGALTVPSKTMI
ncbi:Fungal Zn2-Cys6 binuclear cluster domain-containing protein, partial [Cladophialophora immunda]